MAVEKAPIRLRMRVYDRWWLSWGVGTVVKLTKTRATIRFTERTLVYDAAHLQFLKAA
jgi:hypothetical protein